jgi:hypothetical protein
MGKQLVIIEEAKYPERTTNHWASNWCLKRLVHTKFDIYVFIARFDEAYITRMV